MLGVLVVCLGLLYIRLRGADYYSASSRDPGYATDKTDEYGNHILVEGFERYYLYPGSYHLEIQAQVSDPNSYYQVYDRYNNRVLAMEMYSVDEATHGVSFTIDTVCEDVIVQSVSVDADASIEISGYSLESDRPVCEDARWSAALIAILAGILYLTYGYGVRHGRFESLILMLSATMLSLPLFGSNMQWGHNIPFHMTRIYNIARSITQGYFPSRMNLLTGGDSIIPIMYPETFLVGAGIMVSTGATVFLAFKVLCACITYATAIAAYYAARQVITDRQALLFAILWLINPFRMNELFIRAAIGEALAILFLPLVAVGMWQVMHGSCKRGSVDLVLGYVGILSSHILTGIIAAFFCAVYVIGMLLWNPRQVVAYLRRIGWMILSAAVVVLIKVYWLVPFLTYYGWDFYLSNGEDSAGMLQDSTSPIWQLFMGATGYGGNIQGTQVQGEMPLTIGIACLLGMIGWLVYRAYRRHLCVMSAGEAAEQVISGNAVEEMAGWAIACSLCAVYMASRYFPWDYMLQQSALFARTLGSMQFSWRLLVVPACLLSFVLAILLTDLLQAQRRWMQAAAILLAGLALVTGVQTATSYYSTNASRYTDHYDNEIYLNLDYVLSDAVRDHGDELRSWVRYLYTWPVAEHTDDGITLHDWQRSGNGYVLTVSNTNDEDAIVTVPVFWYGLHRAYLVEESRDTALTVTMNQETQLTEIQIPAGVTDAVVQLVYEEPALFRAGYAVSGIIVLVLLVGYAMCRRRGWRSGQAISSEGASCVDRG